MAKSKVRNATMLLCCVVGICTAAIIESTSALGGGPTRLEGGFCAGGIMHDYARPLRRLSKRHTLPVSGGLPFGPNWLRVEKFPLSASDRYHDPYFGHVLFPGASEFGYVLLEQGNAAAGVDLDWTATARMLVISRSGTLGREVARKRFRIGRVGKGFWRKLTLSALRRPGLYQFDIRFKNRFGRMLGKFQEHLRVVPFRFRAKLVINRPVLHREESTAIRIENIGTSFIIFEEEFSSGFRLQRFDGLGWVEVPVPIQRRTETNRVGGIPNVYIGIPAGWSTRCIGSIQISPEFEAGLYRVLKPVKIARRHGLSPPINLAAEFQVIE